MNKIETIIKNAKVNLADIERNLKLLLREEHFQPRADLKLLKEISKGYFTNWRHPRMLGLSGLRGTGKTTLLWQTAKYIYESKLNREIYFFNVEDLVDSEISISDLSRTMYKLPEFEEQTVLGQTHQILSISFI